MHILIFLCAHRQYCICPNYLGFRPPIGKCIYSFENLYIFLPYIVICKGQSAILLLHFVSVLSFTDNILQINQFLVIKLVHLETLCTHDGLEMKIQPVTQTSCQGLSGQ